MGQTPIPLKQNIQLTLSYLQGKLCSVHTMKKNLNLSVKALLRRSQREK